MSEQETNPTEQKVVENLKAAQAALQSGDRDTAYALANEAYALASEHGPAQAVPDAAFLRGMATENPEERAASLTEALELLEKHGRTEDAETLRQMLSGGGETRPVWADELEAAVATRDMDKAFAVLDAARAKAEAAGHNHEVAAVDNVMAQLRGLRATTGDRELQDGETTEAHLERLVERVQFEAGAGDTENVKETCAALTVASDEAGAGLAIQAGLVIVQALAHIGELDAAKTRLEVCRGLLPDMPAAQGAFDQVEAFVKQRG